MKLFRRLESVFAAGLLFLAAGCASPKAGTGLSGSDAELAALVAQRLAVDPALRDQFFGIDVSGGIVTVRGTVRSEAERLRLIGAIRGTPGVAGVNDRLRLVP